MTDTSRNYVAAFVDWKTDKIIVLERDREGKLHRVKYNSPYYFYVRDDEGTHTSIFGDKLIKAEFESRDEFIQAKEKLQREGFKLFESDFRPLQRVLMDYYYDRPAPIVNYAFLDIEVDYTQKIGFAGPINPYAPISAVTIFQSWTGEYITYALAPSEFKGSVKDLGQKIEDLISSKQLRETRRPKIKICVDEIELLKLMCEALEGADIYSGWHSEFYDIPYICKRMEENQIPLGKLEYLGAKPPKLEHKFQFKVKKGQKVGPNGEQGEPVYNFSGKSHLDYMALFKKFTFEGRTSYALGNILQEEVGVGKLEYDGTLEELYHNDFPTYVAYNFRDVDGLVQLDGKFKFIALANQMSHENTVLFPAVLGTVAYVETGITNHAHNKLNKIVHDKRIVETEKVEGAIVMSPRIGLHEWIGSVDINSLYPNTIRALNISPEMIVGQFGVGEDTENSGEVAWLDIKNGNEKRHTLTLENGQLHTASASEWKRVLTEQKWAISAYGTVFDQGKGKGVVADILGYWYSERKRLQAEKKKWAKKVKELPDGPEKEEAKKKEEDYDLLQLTKKISMNSLYGALLNAAFRFGDERMGASVTGSGRGITGHMIETIGGFLTGTRNPLIKRWSGDVEEAGNKRRYVVTSNIYKNEFTWQQFLDLSQEHKPGLMAVYGIENEAIIYGDTDSCYYRCMNATNKAEAIELADAAAADVNDSFPQFMRDAFNCQPGFDDLIKAGREIVGVRGIFQAKKKYMIKVVDLEGFEVDKLKTQGSEIKKADTPKIIQKFLKHTVDMILGGAPYDEVATYVNQQRKELLKKKNNVFALGVAKQVNNLEKYIAEYNNPGTIRTDKGGKLTVPGHARAACNFNFLLDLLDKGAKSIRSGDKVIIFYLKPNEYKFDSIAFPAEFSKFPKWFAEYFEVDIKKTEERMFDSKLGGIFEALGKDVPSPQSVLTNSILEF